MAYQMAATMVTLNDLERYLSVAGLFKCNPSNIYAAFYTISTDSMLARFLCISRASCLNKDLTMLRWNDQYRDWSRWLNVLMQELLTLCFQVLTEIGFKLFSVQNDDMFSYITFST